MPQEADAKTSTQKLLDNLPALTNMVRRIAIDAGEVIMKYYEMGDLNHVEDKADGSPVSLADRDAEMLIQISLQQITPDIPMIGEESSSLGRAPSLYKQEYFWLVDPLDGTKEFINGSEDFTVNIALIKGDTPIMGVVYLPATGVLYAGHEPGSAIRWSEDTEQDKSISVRPPPEDGLTIVASKSHGNKDELDAFLKDFKVKKVTNRGSSMKICAVAEGKADMYPRLGPTCEWDTGAAHAVLNAAGGCLTTTEGVPLTYGHTDTNMLNPYFIASSVNWFTDDD